MEVLRCTVPSTPDSTRFSELEERGRLPSQERERDDRRETQPSLILADGSTTDSPILPLGAGNSVHCG